MKKTTITLIALFVVSLALAAEAQALTPRTFVSSTGNNANDCSFSAPCRNFAGAIPKTSTGGEVTALDSAFYGFEITIDKSITLQAAPGVQAFVGDTRTRRTAVSIDTSESGVVVLRNLYISRARATAQEPTTGIRVTRVGSLHIESCVVTGFTEYGILAADNVNEGLKSPKLFVKDTIIRNNGTGILLGSVQASIDRSRIENNGTGVSISSQMLGATIRDSLMAGNSDYGLKIEDLLYSGGAATNVENCVVTNNGTGIYSGLVSWNPANDPGPRIVFVSHTMISGNDTGLAGNGHIRSFANNRLANNGTNGVFTHTLQEQ